MKRFLFLASAVLAAAICSCTKEDILPLGPSVDTEDEMPVVSTKSGIGGVKVYAHRCNYLSKDVGGTNKTKNNWIGLLNDSGIDGIEIDVVYANGNVYVSHSTDVSGAPTLDTFLSTMKTSYNNTKKLVIDVKSTDNAATAGRKAVQKVYSAGVQNRVEFIVGQKANYDAVYDEIHNKQSNSFKCPVAYMNSAASYTNFTDHWGNFNINNDDGSPRYSTFKEFKTFADNFKAHWSNGKVSIYDCVNSNKTFPSYYLNWFGAYAGQVKWVCANYHSFIKAGTDDAASNLVAKWKFSDIVTSPSSPHSGTWSSSSPVNADVKTGFMYVTEASGSVAGHVTDMKFVSNGQMYMKGLQQGDYIVIKVPATNVTAGSTTIYLSGSISGGYYAARDFDVQYKGTSAWQSTGNTVQAIQYNSTDNQGTSFSVSFTPQSDLYVNGSGYMYLRLRVKSTTGTGGKTITASQPTRLMGEWSVKTK